MLGTVLRVCVDKGFGFIKQRDGDDVFFHISSLAPDLTFCEQLTEARVEFDLQESPKGPRAANVRLAK